MYTQTIFLAVLTVVAEARFGQEQGNGAIAAIQALSDLGSSGKADTLAGTSIQFLLAAANPCGKLTQADLIVTELGTNSRAIAAARGLVAAEQNFNPFVVSIPSICSDPTLPKTAALRGVVPLIDPAVGGEVLENSNSNKSITAPFGADGLSVAQVMVAQGFSNFTAEALDGTKEPASQLGSSRSSGSATGTSPGSPPVTCSEDTTTIIAPAATSSDCPPATVTVTVTQSADAASSTTTTATTAVSTSAPGGSGTCTGSGSTLLCTSPGTGFGAKISATEGAFAGFVASTVSGLNFGLCVPTLKFEAGLDGRKFSESTFQAIDPLCNKGQQEALNPAIIMNRICDQLTNVCGANAAAKTACQTALSNLGGETRDVTTANAWNKELGFANTNTNPDNAPKTGLIGHV